MSKKLILAIAFSLVLASGSLFSAQADCGLCGFHLPSLCGLNLNPCGWHMPSLCGFGCGAKNVTSGNVDKPIANQYPQGNPANPAY